MAFDKNNKNISDMLKATEDKEPIHVTALCT